MQRMCVKSICRERENVQVYIVCLCIYAEGELLEQDHI